LIIDPNINERVINLTINIQQIAAPTFDEQQRAEFIARTFCEQGIQDVELDQMGNVYARIIGQGNKPPLVVSAHLDTVFPRDTDLTMTWKSEKIVGPGIGDNSLGLAGLLGLYWALNSSIYEQSPRLPLASDVWLVANVSEEGLGNLSGMQAVVNRFGKDVNAYIILEGMSLGYIFHRALGVKRYQINIHTKGGHSWLDYGNPSAVHVLADLVVKINHLYFPAEPRTTYNVGVISGGTTINTIAAEASAQLDLRSLNPDVLGSISDQIEDLVELENRKGGEEICIHAEVIGERPAGEIPADHPLVKLAMECHSQNGVDPKLNIGSTDANIPISRGYPAICMGLTTGGGAHTTSEYIDIPPISQGLRILADLVQMLSV
jgi:acetylornithine deacetylase/succinyl-diaminopimelate desuccinylase-like protein